MSDDLKIWSALVHSYCKADDKKEFGKRIDSVFMELSFKFCEGFMANDQNCKYLLNNTESTMFYLMESYRILVRHKKLERIEVLPNDVKKEIYSEAKLWSKSQDKETLIKFSKVVWLVEHLLNIISENRKYRTKTENV